MSFSRRLARKLRRVERHIARPPEPQIKLENPVSAHFEDFITRNAPHAHDVIREGSAAGQHVVICGAGPSLAEHAGDWCPNADQVWGCNSAVTWLHQHGHRVTHGFTVDQTGQMIPEWTPVFTDVEYLVASTVDPALTAHLESHDARLRWFHNYVGIDKPDVTWPDRNGVYVRMLYEDRLYQQFYPSTVRVGSGLSATTRAIDAARYMGFAKITILGADCSMRIASYPTRILEHGSPEHLRWLQEDTVMHVDGGHALASDASALTMGLIVDPDTSDDTIRPGHGRQWATKVDLMVSAVWLVTFAHAGIVTLIGDTLPNALMRKDREYLQRLPSFVDANGDPIDIAV